MWANIASRIDRKFSRIVVLMEGRREYSLAYGERKFVERLGFHIAALCRA